MKKLNDRRKRIGLKFGNIFIAGGNPDNDVDYQRYKEQVKIDIERVRDKVNVLFVAMHWGIEYQIESNSYQIDAAKYLASLGVELLLVLMLMLYSQLLG